MGWLARMCVHVHVCVVGRFIAGCVFHCVAFAYERPSAFMMLCPVPLCAGVAATR